ncbi:unnamed protein product [Cunninghamella blakesleeana]
MSSEKRDFRLFNWKLDDDSGKRKAYNWYGKTLDDEEYNKLRIGDCVRLMLMSTENKGWEKIYFEIVKINYYKKGSLNVPRTYFGKAMDTYRTMLGEKYDYVNTGDVISFQKNNIIEIPSWTDHEQSPIKKQENTDKIDRSLNQIYKAEYWEDGNNDDDDD